jgi:RHH-type rel operon transcriptional repressor/antitoxin RelB
MSDAISVRLPEELAEKLEQLAESLDRSKTYIIKRALQEYLEEYEDYLVALHRLNDKDDEIVSLKGLTAALD